MYVGIRYLNLGLGLANTLINGFIVSQYTTSNAAATDIPMAHPYIPPKIAKNKAISGSLLIQNENLYQYAIAMYVFIYLAYQWWCTADPVCS